MSHRYILLLDQQSQGGSPASFAAHEDALCAAGMEYRFASASLKLFTSSDTPTLVIPDHGIVLGHIFTKGGQRVTGTEAFGHTRNEIVTAILSDHWGEYLLLLHDDLPGQDVAVLRDPSGGVSCAYSLDGGRGFITSDISLAVDLGLYRRQIDWQAITQELSSPYLRTARTTLTGVRELLPGCLLQCREADVTTTTVWSPWKFVADDRRHDDPRAAAAEVRDSITTVVRALAALDRRFLVQLSGGLDSSIVATCLGEAAARATLCTLVMPVAGTDERPYARLVANTMGRELISVPVGMDDVSIDFPAPPSAVVPAPGVLQHATNMAWEIAASEHGADTLFSGSGGDTIFCYLKTAAPAADAFRACGLRAGLTAIRDLSALHECTVWTAGRLAFKKLLRSPRPTWKEDRSLLNPALHPELRDMHPWMDAPPDALPGDRERIADLIGTQLYRHARPYGETRPMRFPLLAQPTLEACLKVPTWMWIAGGRNRAVAREAFADRLPAGILDRRSKGSYAGFLAGIYARNREQIRQFLANGELASHGLLDLAALTSFLGRELAPRDLSFLRTFDLCAVETWVRSQRPSPSSAR